MINIKNTIIHFTDIFVYGSLAVLILEIDFWLESGLILWSLELVFIWIPGIILVGFYLELVCIPALQFLAKNRPLNIQILTGSASGILTVLIFAIFCTTPDSFNFEYIFKRIWLFYFMFSLIGGTYALRNYHRNKIKINTKH